MVSYGLVLEAGQPTPGSPSSSPSSAGPPGTVAPTKLAIFDKTIANVLGYAHLVLDAPDGSIERCVLDAMAAFCRAWAPVYDAVFYLHDRYDAHTAADPLRACVLDLQDDTDHAVRAACTDSGISLIDVPTGLDLDARVGWVAARLVDLGLVRG